MHLGLKFIFKHYTFYFFWKNLNYKLIFIFLTMFLTKKLKTVHFVPSFSMLSTHVWHSQKFQEAKSLIEDLLWNGTQVGFDKVIFSLWSFEPPFKKDDFLLTYFLFDPQKLFLKTVKCDRGLSSHAWEFGFRAYFWRHILFKLCSHPSIFSQS